MTTAGFIDLTACAAILAAIGFLIAGWGRAMGHDAKIFLGCLFVVLLADSVGNALTWLGITSVSESYEVYLELLQPVLWMLFVYAALQDVSSEALRRSEERYALAQRAAGIGTWEWHISSGEIRWSDNIEPMFGFSKGGFRGTYEAFLECIHPDDRQAVLDAVDSAILGVRDYRVEHRIVWPDGTVRRMVETGDVVRNEQGHPIRMLGVVQDRTDRRLLEEDRARIFNMSLDLLCIGDFNGHFRQVNPAFTRTLGWSEEEFLHRPWKEFVHPDDIASAVSATEQLQRDEKLFAFECRCLCKSGEYRWISWNTVPLIEEGLTFSVARDMTEHRQTEEELTRARNLLLAAIEQSPAGILIADAPDVRIRLANRAALGIRGATDEPLSEIPVELHPDRWQVFHPDGSPFAPEDRPLSQAVLFGKTSRNVEAIIRRSDGEDRWVLANAAPVQDAHGDTVAGVVVISDITEIKRAEEERRRLENEVQHAQKLESLGVLAGGIAHDFNNLLTGILGNASQALLDIPPDSPACISIDQIEKAAVSAAELTRQMLAYAGKGQFIVGPLDFSALVSEMSRLLEVSISKKATLQCELESDLPPIVADAAQIRQVVMNLITNAAEALGDEPGVVRVTTGTATVEPPPPDIPSSSDSPVPGLHVFLEVSDTGCGMDEETRARMFDPFYTTKFTGRGLGLSAVLGIVRGHGGTLHVDSEVGRGTTLRVLFPAAKSSAAPAPIVPNETWEGHGTILVVDDEEAVRNLASRILSRAGCDVLEAENGREALNIFAQRADEIDAVLLDMTMPVMNGEETFEQLRVLCPDVRVVLTSGHDQQHAISAFAGKGLSGFLQKPFRPGELLSLLRRVLENPRTD